VLSFDRKVLYIIYTLYTLSWFSSFPSPKGEMETLPFFLVFLFPLVGIMGLFF